MIKLAKQNIRGSIKTKITEMIESQNLQPGDKIISQNELAGLLKISAPMVCRALNELAEDGILYRIQGKGTFVAEPINMPEAKQPDSELTIAIYPFENYHGNDYLQELIEGISQGLLRYRLRCKYVTIAKFENSGLSISEYMFANQIDGIITVASHNKFLDQTEELVKDGFPCVTINRLLEGCDSVCCDHYDGVDQIMNKLSNFGHHKILYAGLNHELIVHQRMRYKSYCDFCKAKGFEAFVYETEGHDSHSGEKLAKYFLSMKKRPTAIVLASSSILLDLLKVLNEHGIEVPDDISIVTYDEQYLPYKYKKFSCVKQPLHKMGLIATDIMNKKLRLDNVKTINVNLNPDFILGDSIKVLKTERRESPAVELGIS